MNDTNPNENQILFHGQNTLDVTMRISLWEQHQEKRPSFDACYYQIFSCEILDSYSLLCCDNSMTNGPCSFSLSALEIGNGIDWNEKLRNEYRNWIENQNKRTS